MWRSTYQLPWTIWVTREVDCNVTPYISRPWWFASTKKCWNSHRVHLHNGIQTHVQIKYKLASQAKSDMHSNYRYRQSRSQCCTANKNARYTWPCLKRRTCMIFVSSNLQMNPVKWTSVIFQAKNKIIQSSNSLKQNKILTKHFITTWSVNTRIVSCFCLIVL